MPATEPQHSAWELQLLGLYHDEVSKWLVARGCRLKVRAANQRAYEAVSGR